MRKWKNTAEILGMNTIMYRPIALYCQKPNIIFEIFFFQIWNAAIYYLLFLKFVFTVQISWRNKNMPLMLITKIWK